MSEVSPRVQDLREAPHNANRGPFVLAGQEVHVVVPPPNARFVAVLLRDPDGALCEGWLQRDGVDRESPLHELTDGCLFPLLEGTNGFPASGPFALQSDGVDDARYWVAFSDRNP